MTHQPSNFEISLPPQHAQVRALFQHYANSSTAEQLINATRAQVVDWRWATDTMSMDEPFRHQINRTPQGRWLNAGKEKANDHVLHGFDHAGRIIFERAYNCFEAVWLYEANQHTKIEFDTKNPSGLKPHAVSRFVLQSNGLIASVHSCFSDEPLVHSNDLSLVWEGGRLLEQTGIQTYQQTYSNQPCFFRYRYEYAADDELESIKFYLLSKNNQPIGKPQVKYRRLVKGETIPLLATAIKDELLQQIPKSLKRLDIPEAIYCLLLCYTHEDFESAWPPFLVWGKKSYRDSIDKEVGYYLWAPDEIREKCRDTELWLDQEHLVSLCLRHKTLMSDKNSFASAKKVLIEVAQQLNTLDWRSITPVTDDFVVVAVDNSGEVNLHKDIKACLTPERFALLKSSGWLKE